jgi:tetratricopeptide (TPR) repeat protein
VCDRRPTHFVIETLAAVLLATTVSLAQSGDAPPQLVPVSRQAIQRDTLLNRGYDLLKKGDRAGALHQFEAAVALDPTNVLTLKQIGFLKLQDGDLQSAADSFEAARAVAPRDYSLALQLGYTYERLGKQTQAKDAFRAALDSPDQQVRLNAVIALKSLTQENRRWYFDLYGSPLYMSRFGDGIAIFQGHLGWKPAPELPLSLYLGGEVTRDTRSQGGALPIIFSDNVALVGTGILYQPRHSHFNLRAEANAALPLISDNSTYAYSARSDYRVIGSYYNRFDGKLWGPVGLLTLARARGERLFSDLDGSAGYYSRYNNNGIAYLQNREGLRLWTIGHSQTFGYLKYDLAKDTHRDFYNNFGEGGAGMEFRPDKTVNLGLRFEYLRGSYFGIAREPNPYRPNYNDFRVMLVFGHRF